MDLHLSTSNLGGYAVVSVSGEIDLESAAQLSEHALTAAREVSPNIVLDLSRVTFMDSTGLQVLIAVKRRAELAGGSLALVGVARAVMKVLTVTGLRETFTITDSIEDITSRLPAEGASHS